MVMELWLHVDCGIKGWERIKPVVLPFSGLQHTGERAGGLWMGQNISPICLPSPDADLTEIKNKFVAARSQLPIMFIATPKDRWSSMWTQERPSVQVCWALCPCPVVAAGLGQFLAPSAGASSNGPVSERGPCYIQDCRVSPSGFLPSPDPAAPSRAGFRVSPCPGGAAHGPAQQPGCKGNPLGCQHKDFQALTKHTCLQ